MNTQIIDVSSNYWQEILQKTRHDIYHLPEYFYLEGKRTHTTPEAILIIAGEKYLFAPYLLRQCDDISNQLISETYDVISPYGYPGILLSEAAGNSLEFIDEAMQELKFILRAKNVCSAFFRLHPILNYNFAEVFPPDTFTLNGETVSIDLKLSESEIWNHTRGGHRSTINKCKRLGLQAKIVPLIEYIDDFMIIYEETMARVGAGKSYLSFDYKYFIDMQNILGEKVHLCVVELEKEIVCAGLYTESDGIVQSTWGGTKNNFVKLSPGSLETDYARLWAKKRGNEFLHLGGGLGGGKDSLSTFKTGFSRQRHTFLTLRLITDQEKYRDLVELRAKTLDIQTEELLKSDFFPAYRSLNKGAK